MIIGFLFRSKDFKADVLAVPILSFIGTLQAYRENMSMAFKTYYIRRCISRGNLNLQDPFPDIINVSYNVFPGNSKRFVQSVRVLN